ncbi:MAG: DUF58 domain-containing protein [Bacteroidetes bacterium]|nr:DUF58 domain-containing protein [Bacteroidota bacterium]
MNFFRSTFAQNLFFIGIFSLAAVFIAGQFVPLFLQIAEWLSVFFGAAVLIDLLMLYARPEPILAERISPVKLSNGDTNTLHINLQSQFPFNVTVEILDELPEQLQIRNFRMLTNLAALSSRTLEYSIRPCERGEYHFGNINIFCSGPIGIFQRRIKVPAKQMIPSYPSFIQMHKYELIAASNRLTDAGIKKIRKVGHQLEFDQIREYVRGDDYRTINWNATARKSDLMVNQYQDEKSQQVYCVLDAGRAMKMPFDDLTLLDYSVNASLVLSNIALMKYDKAGLLTYSNKIRSFMQADRKPGQIIRVMEHLYNLETGFEEPDMGLLYAHIHRRISQRSLIILFTNFESLAAADRQLAFLKKIARRHLLAVVIFENTEVKSLTSTDVVDTEGIYIKAIAEKFIFEKRRIAVELRNYGIHSTITEPAGLTVAALNKYLEFKALGMI